VCGRGARGRSRPGNGGGRGTESLRGAGRRADDGSEGTTLRRCAGVPGGSASRRVVPQAVRGRRDLGAGGTVAERVGRCSPAAGRAGRGSLEAAHAVGVKSGSRWRLVVGGLLFFYKGCFITQRLLRNTPSLCITRMHGAVPRNKRMKTRILKDENR
jgi:hypothetical protein